MDPRGASNLSSDLRQQLLEQRVEQTAENSRLQVVLLQRIAGYTHVIQWAAIFAALMLLLVAIK